MAQNLNTVRLNLEQQQGLLTDTKEFCPPEKTKPLPTPKDTFKGIKYILVSGTIAIAFGITSCIWTPYQFLLNQRLFMYPGLPPYEWWLIPPDILLNIYIFNYTNMDEFLSGNAQKLRVEEIGPIAYYEHVEHTNIRFNDNGTFSYVSNRTAIFSPEKSNIDLNATIIQPNMALLGMATYLQDAPFFAKLGFNLLVKRLGSEPINRLTIYELLWNYTEPVLETAHAYFTSIAPINNMGVLKMIYDNYVDEVTVYIGRENERRYFTMSTYQGSEYFKYRKREQCDRVEDSTEGVSFHHSIRKTDILYYFRKKVCRTIPVTYANTIINKDLKLYRFEITPTLFNRPENISEDCFTEEGEEPLPSGVINISPCTFDFPVGVSWPHFLFGDPTITDHLEGLKSDRDRHISYIVLEPTMGIPVQGSARMQMNIVVGNIAGNSNIKLLSNKILPIAWMEYTQEELPWYIYYLIYFTVVVMPPLQTVVTGLMLCYGFGCLFYIIITMLKMRTPNNRSLRFFPLKLISPISSSDVDRS